MTTPPIVTRRVTTAEMTTFEAGNRLPLVPAEGEEQTGFRVLGRGPTVEDAVNDIAEHPNGIGDTW